MRWLHEDLKLDAVGHAIEARETMLADLKRARDGLGHRQRTGRRRQAERLEQPSAAGVVTVRHMYSSLVVVVGRRSSVGVTVCTTHIQILNERASQSLCDVTTG
jgi:hypothetical protein